MAEPVNASDPQRHGPEELSPEDAPHADAVGRRGGAPGYDTSKETYAGISAGALDHLDDVHAARDFAEMIVDTVREGLLVLDLDLHVQAANESFYRTFGVDPEDTVGRLVYDLGNGQWDLPELRELLEGILPHDKALNDYEVDHAFEGIGRRQMLLNARRLDDHEMILLAIEDVTERRQDQRTLRESEERFRSVSESGLITLAFFDTHGAITDANDAFLDLIGYTREELEAGEVRWDRLTPEEWMPETRAAVEEFERTGRIEPYEKEYLRKGGERFWGLFGGRRLESTGEGVAFVLDITERKRTEERLSEFNETLEAHVKERTKQVRELSRALALAEQEERRRIAHVLHDDLQQVLFGAKVASSMGNAEQLEGVLDEAITRTRSLSHSLSPPFLEGEDLEDLLRWVAERQRMRYGLEVEVEVGAGVPVPEAALRVLLYQAIRELLFNVAKHAGVKRARLVATRTDEHVRLAVEDEGAGFDPAELEEPSNVGLGLPSVRERLEVMGGTVEVSSAPGEGTRVTITVPVGEGS